MSALEVLAEGRWLCHNRCASITAVGQFAFLISLGSRLAKPDPI